MRYGIIDVGSNSVRLLLDDVKTSINTQLAEKAASGGCLLPAAMARTAKAVKEFVRIAEINGAIPKVFATEAVRSAKNKDEFLSILKADGIDVDVLNAETEAKIGFDGAYCGNGKIQAVLDLGGASSELAVGDGKKLIYAHSIPLGSVRLKDYSDDNEARAAYAKKVVAEYGEVPAFTELITIGGTSSSIVSVRDALVPYDPAKVHMQKLSLSEIYSVVTKISETPVNERVNIKGLHPQKIHILPAGGILIAEIMKYLGVTQATVSESDNLEGYLKLSDRS